GYRFVPSHLRFPPSGYFTGPAKSALGLFASFKVTIVTTPPVSFWTKAKNLVINSLQFFGSRHSHTPQNQTRLNRAHPRRAPFAAVPCPHAQLRVRNLPFAGLLAQLQNRFGYSGQVREVVRRKHSAARIYRSVSPGPDVPLFHVLSTFAFCAPTVVFELKNYLCGKAVVKLGHIQILQLNPCLSEGRLFRFGNGQFSKVGRNIPPLASLRVPKSDPQHAYRTLGTGARSLRRC